jgi:NAD(P)-dependent dehydrogenase (short-subunit alcohol dehydrogenase family)
MWLMSRWFAPAGERGKMNLKFENKTALVSASTAGIGFAIALELAWEGARVFLNGRTEKRVWDAARRIQAKSFEKISDADWQRMFEINVMSGVRLSPGYLPGMRERNWGRIVFISSESALHIPAEMVHYGMTKTAQVAVARGIAESCAGTGVTGTACSPDPPHPKA